MRGRERESERKEEPKKPRRARLRSSSPTASHPKTDRPRPRSSSPIASHPKTDRPRPRLSSPITSHPKTNRPRPRSSSPIAISSSHQSRSQHQSASRDLASRWTQSRPDYEFFFWVLFVFLDWGMILHICLATDKLWENVTGFDDFFSRFCLCFKNTTKH